MIGGRTFFALLLDIPLGLGLGKKLSQRTGCLSLRGLPVKSVFLTRITPDLSGIIKQAITVIVVHGVLHLRIDECQACLDGIEFVGADTTVDYLLDAGAGIKAPTVLVHDERDGERPLILADNENGLVFSIPVQPLAV